MTSRTLAHRLAAARTERAPAQLPRPVVNDRLALLARWFDARTQVVEDGTALVVERSVGVPAGVAEALAPLPAAAYFDTETTGLSTGAGTVIFMAGVARVDGARVTVRQYLLPDYPQERALLRALSADLAASPRLVTYNGRAFDLPMLTARLTFHGLFREQALLPDTHDDLLPDARRLFRR
ncbi:MAG: ribonuclease H-like domain-containing protein, partial [Chloroflexi bacterium]|nr:ribonuclease H-like domain-containing protein [Chloroflexota bacterium]